MIERHKPACHKSQWYHTHQTLYHSDGLLSVSPEYVISHEYLVKLSDVRDLSDLFLQVDLTYQNKFQSSGFVWLIHFEAHFCGETVSDEG